ncbi:hypothetical protein [Fibrella aquatica]|jgi:hypothetical protein|uniref:hypothetical protein n=1 Tax=Fibrella aquatica TaxID=3242487 RepID=UPI00352185D1
MPSLNVLFWNVQKKDLITQITNLVESKDVDILILAENPVSSERLVDVLSTVRFGKAYTSFSKCEKITIITRFSNHLIKPIEEDPRLTIRQVSIPGIDPFLLTALHLPDKMSADEESQSENASSVATQLIIAENRLGLKRHLVVGDFNMNPFERGMIKANGFHGTMSSEIASKGARTVQGKSYPYFYNPTWGLFGDLNKEASGTYYYRKAEHVCYEWNLFDQVLIRPSLIANFVKESLTIVQQDSVSSLIKRNSQPNKNAYSDHLPLFFTLNF